MAAGRHNLTRRALLGAAAGVPLAAITSPADETPTPFALSLSKGCPSFLAEGDESAGLRQAQPERDSGASTNARWHRALAAFRRAGDRLAAFRAWEGALPAAARAFPACRPLEARAAALESARLAAPHRLLRAPAPDLPALALKPVLSDVEGVQLAVDDEIAFFPGGDLCLAAVKADALRLCHG
jgi:hypothetical protein